METIYYRLNAARITVEGDRKVSGGEGVYYTVLPKKTAHAPAEGKVLDFEACRQALMGEQPPAAEPEEPAGPAPTVPKRRSSPWLAAELCATAAVVFFTALTALGVLFI